MYIFYMDDSGEDKKHIFTALGVKVEHWREVFLCVKKYRQDLRQHSGIFMKKELHATKFISGRGRPSKRHVSIEERERIFNYGLRTLAGIGPDKVCLFNSINRNQQYAYERLLNRINRTMTAWDNYAIIISDEGKEAEYTKLVRKMGTHNPIPSKFGVWKDDGTQQKNIPIDRIIEDPVFRNSEASHFIQLVDFCAYALLRKEIPMQKRPTLSESFSILEPICVKAANPSDPYGIAR